LEADLGGSTDEELLELFFNRKGDAAESAFRTLVARHGPMVLGVCRHILNQQQDAEDAFQATFLVLARKGRSIRSRNVLGRWLYEVAYRIALRAKTQAVRRRVHERQAVEMSPLACESELAWNELRPVLHEEVNRLPEKYRTPVVLCYFEGKTNEEVAQLLDWPVGTVKGRLARARDLLRSRLMRRGLALSAGFLMTALSENRVFAEIVPSRLIDATVRSGMLVAAGEAAAISAEVAELMKLDGHVRLSERLIRSATLLLWTGGLVLIWSIVLASWIRGSDSRLPGRSFSLSSIYRLVGPSAAACCHTTP
jgi:RNA polymerase sigma factor (sigma-70 family)